MPNRTYKDREKIMKWVEVALESGHKNPQTIRDYIEQNADIDPPPSIPTIGNAMKELGYAPAGKDWQKKKGK